MEYIVCEWDSQPKEYMSRKGWGPAARFVNNFYFVGVWSYILIEN